MESSSNRVFVLEKPLLNNALALIILRKFVFISLRVSILISKKWKCSIKNWEAIDKIILKLDMYIWAYKLTIIGMHASNEDNGVTKKYDFFLLT